MYDHLTQGLDDDDCATEQCSTCNFQGEVYFKLKGICHTSSVIDTDYSMKFDPSNQENFYFRGFSGLTSIFYSSTNNGWIIKNYKMKNSIDIFGFFNATTIPIGLHTWSMFTTCEIVNKNPQNVTLKLTKVIIMCWP